MHLADCAAQGFYYLKLSAITKIVNYVCKAIADQSGCFWRWARGGNDGFAIALRPSALSFIESSLS